MNKFIESIVQSDVCPAFETNSGTGARLFSQGLCQWESSQNSQKEFPESKGYRQLFVKRICRLNINAPAIEPANSTLGLFMAITQAEHGSESVFNALSRLPRRAANLRKVP